MLRRPVAIASSGDGSRLLVANRDSGSVSVVDLAAKRVAAEHTLGRRLADLVAIPGTNHLLAADEQAHELLLLKQAGDDVKVVQRLAISPYPISICLAADGRSASVASLWSRRLTFVEWDTASDGLEVRATTALDLPFAPRCQQLLPGRDRLLVADAFGGRLAVIEASSRKFQGTRQFPGHNIRGTLVYGGRGRRSSG